MRLGFRRRPGPPPALAAGLGPDELLLAAAKTDLGAWLGVTRFGVWLLPAGGATPTLIGWPLISKARWAAPTLQLTVADVAGRVGSADFIVDREPIEYRLDEPGKLTDVIYRRIRGGIISSEQHDFGGSLGGGWVVIRRVPGQNGAIAQVRLDPGTDSRIAADRLAGIVEAALAPHRQPSG